MAIQLDRGQYPGWWPGGGISGHQTWGDPGEILQVSSRVQSPSLTGRLILCANSNNSNTSFISGPVEVEDSNGEIGEMSAWWWWWWWWFTPWSQTAGAGDGGLINHHYNSSSLLAPLSSPDMKSSVGVLPNKMTKPGIWWPGHPEPRLNSYYLL